MRQGLSAELVADLWGLDREDLDNYALRSYELAAAARDAGRFDSELLPVRSKVGDEVGDLLHADEGIRGTSMERLADLAPSFVPGGRVTAGNSSQIADGAAAVLTMSESRAAELGLRPRARVAAATVAGADPVEMLTAIIPGTSKVLARAGLRLDDIDRFEVNEDFASAVLAWQRALGADLDRVNVNGGGIALGHPLGASGAKLAAMLVHELERSGIRYGLQTMCEGGGLANAMVLERLC